MFHPAYEAELPDGHRFPMRKYGRLAETLRARGLVPDGFVMPEPADAALLSGAHDPAYVAAVLAAQVPRAIERAIGLPVTESVAARSRASAGGRCGPRVSRSATASPAAPPAAATTPGGTAGRASVCSTTWRWPPSP